MSNTLYTLLFVYMYPSFWEEVIEMVIYVWFIDYSVETQAQRDGASEVWISTFFWLSIIIPVKIYWLSCSLCKFSLMMLSKENIKMNLAHDVEQMNAASHAVNCEAT